MIEELEKQLSAKDNELKNKDLKIKKLTEDIESSKGDKTHQKLIETFNEEITNLKSQLSESN